MAENSESPPPPSVEAVLDRFLREAPPHPIELHVTDEVQRLSPGEAAFDFILTDVVHAVLDTEPMPESQPRQIRVQWMQPSGQVASVVFNGAAAHHEILRRAVLAAKQHRCVVRWFRGRAGPLGSSSVDVFNVPRAIGHPGKLAPHARIIDTPERFDVTFGKVDVPGRIGRTVLRRSTIEESWRVVLDAGGLQVARVRRKGTDDVRVPVNELVAIAKSSWGTESGPKQSILTTSHVVEFPRLSFLGRSFGINAGDAWDLEQFVVHRLNQRLGV